MTQVQMIIVGDVETGNIRVQGPIDDMRIVHWLLGEAKRICERRADAKEATPGNGGGLVVPNMQLVKAQPK